MSASVNSRFGSQFEAQVDDSATRVALGSLTGSLAMGARAGVVNRTHRVIRQRAKVMQARRSRMRGLLAPMIICSALLLLIACAVWSGFYQSGDATAAGVVQTDVATVAARDVNNHSMVALLWFLPAGLAVFATVLYRRTRESASDKARQ